MITHIDNHQDAPLMIPGHEKEPGYELLEKVLLSYRQYYNINTESPMPPFDAEAVFTVHNEEYMLVRIAKFAEMDSCEYAFFAVRDHLDAAEADSLIRTAWEEGLRRADPKPNHRNTDVVVFMICNSMDDEVKKIVKKNNSHVSYRFSLWGWSNLKLIACETAGGKPATNRHGQTLSDLIRDIQNKTEKEK